MSGDTQVKNVKVVVAGEASGAKRAFAETEQGAGAAVSKIKAHFSSLFSSLNSSGVLGPFSDMVAQIGQTFDTLGGKAQSAGEKVARIGVAGAGIGGFLTLASQSDQQAARQLGQAFTDVGQNVEDYKGKIDAAHGSMAKFGYTAPQVDNALQQLVQATKDPTESLKLMGTAANLAAARHISLEAATQQLVQVIGGRGARVAAQLGLHFTKTANSAQQLTQATKQQQTAQNQLATAQQKLSDLETIDHQKKTLTIQDHIALRNAQDAVTKAQGNLVTANGKLKDAQDAATKSGQGQQQILDQISQRVSGQASAAADTFTGKLKALRAEVENHIATFGQKYGPVITAAGTGVTLLGSAVTGTTALMEKLRGTTEAVTAAQETLTAGQEAGEVAADGLAAGEGAADAAGMPLILTIGLIVAAVAAIGVAIYELVTHWSTVWGTIKAVVADAWHFIDSNFVQPIEDFFGAIVGFIQQHWQLILGIITGPIGLAVEFIVTHFDQIISFFEGLPGQIMNAISSLLGDLENFGKNIITSIVSGIESMGSAIWDTIKKHIPGSGVIGSALSAIGLAEGGIVTKPTLAVIGEAGYPEAVIPLKNGVSAMGFNDSVQQLQGGMFAQGSTQTTNNSQAVVNISALTNANAGDIASEVTWALGRLVA